MADRSAAIWLNYNYNYGDLIRIEKQLNVAGPIINRMTVNARVDIIPRKICPLLRSLHVTRTFLSHRLRK